MDVSEAIEILERSGFDIHLKREPTLALKLYRTDGKQIVGPLTVYEDLCTIYQDGEAWVFEHWTTVPGPGPDDVVFETDSLEAAVQCAITYYTGDPLILDGWEFSIQKHPEWDAQTIQRSLANTRLVTFGEWWEIRHDYYERYWQAVGDPRSRRWPDHPELRFIQITHKERRDIALWLRCDLQEIFIVALPKSRYT